MKIVVSCDFLELCKSAGFGSYCGWLLGVC